MDNILYKKLKRQYTDNGVSWIDMNVYKVGEVLEDPSNCQSENTKQCRWVELDESEGYICDTETYTKYKIQLKECSTDGIVWTRTGERRQGNIIDFLSPDCGYNGESNCEGGVHEYYNSITEPKIVYRYGNIFLLNPDLIVNYDNKTTFDIKEYFTTNINCYSAHDIMPFNWEYNNSYNLAKSFLIHINTWECDETQGKPAHIIGTWDFNSNKFIQLLTMDECVKFYQYKNDSIILCDCTIYNTWVYYEITSDYGINILTEEEFEKLTTIEVGSAYYYTDKDKTYYDVLVFDGFLGFSEGGTLYYNGEVYENCVLMNYYNDYAFFHTEDKLIVISKNGDYMEYTIDFPTPSVTASYGLVNYYIDGKYYISNANTKQSENTELYVFDNGTLTKEVFPNGYLTEGNYSLPYLYTNPIFKLGVATSDGETLHYGNAVDTYGDSSFNQYEINISGRDYFIIDDEYYDGYDSFFKFLYKNGYITKELTEDEESDVLMATIFIDNIREDILYPTIGLICFEALAEYIKYVFERYKGILNGETGSGDTGNTSGDTGTTIDGNLEFEFIGSSLQYKLGYKIGDYTSYIATTSPYSKYIEEKLIDCHGTFINTPLTNLIEFPDTSNVIYMTDMFAYCRNIPSLALSSFNTNKVIDMSFMFLHCDNLNSLNVSSFDTSNVTGMTQMFSFCPNLTSLDLSNFNTSAVTRMDGMFYESTNLKTLDLSNFNTSNVTDMSGMFYNCNSLTSLDLSNFNTSNITNFTDMFYNCNSLESLNISKFDASNVTSLVNMFKDCTSLKTLNVSEFNTSNVETMASMFKNCGSLTSLDLSNFNTSAVTHMNGMFEGCSSLTSLDLSNFDTSNLTNIDTMFKGCSNLTSLNLSNWDTTNIIHDGAMFENCPKLETIIVANCSEETKKEILANVKYYYTATLNGDVITIQVPTISGGNNLEFEFSGESLKYKLNNTSYTATTSPYSTTLTDLGIDNLTSCKTTFQSTSLTNLIEFPDTSYVTDMTSMFNACNNLTTLIISNFNTSNVTNMSVMFANCNNLTTLSISNFNTSNVTNMSGMFNNCINLTSLDLSSFNTSAVTDMNGIFGNCKNLTTLNLSSFDTSNVTDMTQMFRTCYNLTSLDLSNFNTSAVTDMDSLFFECSGLTSLNLSNWDTSNVKYMNTMFYNCSGLASLDLSNFNTSNVETMTSMFYNCTNLTTLNLSNWNTSAVTDMDSLFFECSGLTSLNLSSFDTSNVTDMYAMFYNCSNLTSLDLSNFDTSNVETMTGMFYNCSGLTILNLSNWDTSNVTSYSNMFKNCTNLTSVTVANCSDTTKQFILNRLNAYYTATLNGDTITVTH